MTRDAVLETLRAHMPELRAYGVAHLAVFGSVARGDDRPESDVDILVDFEAPVGLFKFIDVKDRLEALLGRPVDLVTRAALKPRLRDRILEEAINAG